MASISCCEIALTLAITNVITLALFAGYTVKLKERTIKLEKKNGHEQQQINTINSLLDVSNKQIDQLKREVEALKQSQHD